MQHTTMQSRIVPGDSERQIEGLRSDLEAVRLQLQRVIEEREVIYRFSATNLQVELDELREENARIDGLIAAINSSRERVLRSRAGTLALKLASMRTRLLRGSG